VALDACRGAGAVIMPLLLDRLGCEVTPINMQPDGRFPRPPEPVAENLGELEAATRDAGADVGLAVDPDVDRLALVDERGRAWSPTCRRAGWSTTSRRPRTRP
jgi:phosphomannomutase